MTYNMLKGGGIFAIALSLLPTLAVADTFAPKVLVITMFEAETAPWLKNLNLPNKIAILGLPKGFETVACDADLCVMTTTMGYANAASSAMAVAFSDKLDLSQTYMLNSATN